MHPPMVTSTHWTAGKTGAGALRAPPLPGANALINPPAPKPA